jgi:hypothetical protein
MRRSPLVSSAFGGEKMNEGGRDEAMRKDALTRLVLKGWMEGSRISLVLHGTLVEGMNGE